MAGILKVDKYQDFNGNDIMTSDGSGNITVNNAALKMTPAFEAYLSSAQSISDGVYAKVQCDTEVLDTDNCYDNVTNYRFTPTVAGKYLIYASLIGKSGGDTQLTATQIAIYKNGSKYNDNVTQFYVNYIKQHTMFMSRIIDMNGTTDYVEFYGYVNVSTGTPTFSVDGNKSNFFGAYRIIGA